jgi:septal ring factor EnvC (AmiA/AmiB activator)
MFKRSRQLQHELGVLRSDLDEMERRLKDGEALSEKLERRLKEGEVLSEKLRVQLIGISKRLELYEEQSGAELKG